MGRDIARPMYLSARPAFIDINRSVSAGLSFKGGGWNRPDDVLGVVAVSNGISAPAAAYFRAGGNGILIGDGRLPHYGRERIIETCYAAHIDRHLSMSADIQHIANPAYNSDRGPVRVYGLRVHAEFRSPDQPRWRVAFV